MKVLRPYVPADAVVSSTSISPTRADSGVLLSGGSVFSSSRAVLAGLDPALTQELTQALGALAIDVVSAEQAETDFVFCGPSAVDAERQNRPLVPVIAVSRRQDVAAWLDAIEAGAYDYCAAPFDLVNLGWILKSGTRPSVYRAA